MLSSIQIFLWIVDIKYVILRLLRPLRRSTLLSRTFRLWANQSEAVFSLVTLWRSGHSKNYVRAYLGVSFHTHDYGLRIDFGRQVLRNQIKIINLKS